MAGALGAKAYNVEKQRQLVAKGAETVCEAATRIRNETKKKKKLSPPKSPAVPIDRDDKRLAPAGDGSTAGDSASLLDRPPQDALPLKQHQESVGNKINPTDVVIAPGSNSPGARQPECAIIPLPASQRNQDGLKAELQKLCGRYKTRVIYKQLPLDFVGDAENANDAAHDA